MTKPLALICSVLVLGLMAAGCGSSNSSGGGNTETSTPIKPKGGNTKTSTPTTPKSNPGGRTVTVSQKNIAFNPKSLIVAAGTTVKWTNDDSVNHDVSKLSGPGPDFTSGHAQGVALSGNMAPGATYQQTFNTAGIIKYQCTVHPKMTGTITVK